MAFLAEDPSSDGQVTGELLNSLYTQAHHLSRNLEIDLRGNHLLRDAGPGPDEVETMAAAWQDVRSVALLGMSCVALPAFEMGTRAYQALLRKVDTGRSAPTVSLRGEIREGAQ